MRDRNGNIWFSAPALTIAPAAPNPDSNQAADEMMAAKRRATEGPSRSEVKGSYMRRLQQSNKTGASLCTFCGLAATCIGAYEGHKTESPACDTCCGHGNEDGHCRQLDTATQAQP